MSAPQLTHLDERGEVRMVDVSGKPESFRTAVAVGRISLQSATLALIHGDRIAKGNVLATARLAGIGAAKQTSALIPLCHTLLLQHVAVDFADRADGLAIRAEVRTVGRTGAEMEALTAVTVAALTVYDMCKAVDKTMRIGDVTLESKSKIPLGPDGLRSGENGV